jgi:hypothetical protein
MSSIPSPGFSKPRAGRTEEGKSRNRGTTTAATQARMRKPQPRDAITASAGRVRPPFARRGPRSPPRSRRSPPRLRIPPYQIARTATQAIVAAVKIIAAGGRGMIELGPNKVGEHLSRLLRSQKRLKSKRRSPRRESLHRIREQFLVKDRPDQQCPCPIQGPPHVASPQPPAVALVKPIAPPQRHDHRGRSSQSKKHARVGQKALPEAAGQAQSRILEYRNGCSSKVTCQNLPRLVAQILEIRCLPRLLRQARGLRPNAIPPFQQVIVDAHHVLVFVEAQRIVERTGRRCRPSGSASWPEKTFRFGACRARPNCGPGPAAHPV